MAKAVRISLASKCQLLFGAAVVLILFCALAVVWVRMEKLVVEGQQVRSRQIANAWLTGKIEIGGILASTDRPDDIPESGQISLSVLDQDDWEFERRSRRDPFLARVVDRFDSAESLDSPDANEAFMEARDPQGQPYFRYVRAIRQSHLAGIGGGAAAGFAPGLDATFIADPLRKVLVLQFRNLEVQSQLILNRIYIVAAGLLAGLLAIAVFWFITTRLILSPVRVLRDTAEKVSEGDLNIRAEVNTGDEFEQFSDVFNAMLANLKNNQDQLRGAYKSLDLKLGELAQTNVALYEANKIKGEFLANVSHELRTPLNSIIGFAEVLGETLKDSDDPVSEKRLRYAGNIITSSRRLLDLINDLLDLAKIEAGRMDVRVSGVSVSDTLEGLVTLIRPQAEKKSIILTTRVQANLPVIHTDAGKLQQILFNFLSNAVKFTPIGGQVTIAADPVAGPVPKVRISVADTGPGIPPEQQDRIFEKFTQLDTSVTRQTSGTGLGLTISKELASLLQGEIQLQSEVGHGATFSIVIPLELADRSVPLMPDLVEQRTTTA